MKTLIILGFIQLLAFDSFGQIKLCLEHALSGSTCYSLDTGNIATYERRDFTILVVVKGTYKKTKRSLTIYLDEHVVQVGKKIDTTLTGMIKITHQLHGSPQDSLRFSTIKYLDNVYQTDIYGTVIFPYYGGAIEIVKYGSSQKTIIDPEQQSKAQVWQLGLSERKFNTYDIYWGNGNLDIPTEPTIIKMKKKADKYEVRFKRMRFGPMDETYYVWEKIYFIEQKD